MYQVRLCAFLTIGLVFLLVNCADQNDFHDVKEEVRFLFGMRVDTTGVDEDFVAVTADETVIATARSELQLPASERILHIHGTIGLGGGGHNLQWDWHFLPGQWNLVEESIEICDGVPSAVQASIGTWRDTVASFCPFTSYVKAELR